MAMDGGRCERTVVKGVVSGWNGRPRPCGGLVWAESRHGYRVWRMRLELSRAVSQPAISAMDDGSMMVWTLSMIFSVTGYSR